MGKIMAKLKHNYNAFAELQSKFFHKQCVIEIVVELKQYARKTIVFLLAHVEQ